MSKSNGSASALNSKVIDAIENDSIDLSKNEKREYILMNLLPTYTHDGNLAAVKEILEHYKLDFLEAGEMDYVGNGESADPGDFHFDNLLYIASSEGHNDIIRYFIKDLIRRGIDPEPHVNEADVHNVFNNILRQEDKKRALLMRRKLPNNIALSEIPKYLSNDLFEKKNIIRLQSEKLSNQNMNKYFGNKKGGKTRQHRRTLGRKKVSKTRRNRRH